MTSDVAVYLGEQCPPNMVAHLDGRAAAGEELDVLVTNVDTLPEWLQDQHTERVYRTPERSGIGLVHSAADVVDSYLEDHDADRVEQITQPRWHALGVLLGARGHDVTIATRLPAATFRERTRDDVGWRATIANNLLARAALLADEVRTPTHNAISPWWRSVDREPLPINEERFSPDVEPAESVWTQSDRRVLVVGRVTKAKGLDLALDIAEELPSHEFVVAGERRDAQLVARAANADNVALLGEIPYRDMPTVYAGADALLSCSRQEWGGISRAMLEAAAMDVPVIALNRGRAAQVADQVVGEDVDAIRRALTLETKEEQNVQTAVADGGER